MSFIEIVLWILLIFLAYQVIIRLVRSLVHFPYPATVGVFLDSKYRKLLQPAHKVIERSNIESGMKVLDLGCGSGAFTVDIARKVGPGGLVYAIDTQKGMLRQVQKKIARHAHELQANIHLMRGSAYSLPFDNNTFDLVFMVTVLPELSDKQKALFEIKRVLKPNGILAVSELLIDPDYPLSIKTKDVLKKAQFSDIKMSGNFLNYTVIGYNNDHSSDISKHSKASMTKKN